MVNSQNMKETLEGYTLQGACVHWEFLHKSCRHPLPSREKALPLQGSHELSCSKGSRYQLSDGDYLPEDWSLWRTRLVRRGVVSCPAHWVLSLEQSGCSGEKDRGTELKGSSPKPVLHHSLHILFSLPWSQSTSSTFLTSLDIMQSWNSLHYVLLKVSSDPFFMF